MIYEAIFFFCKSWTHILMFALLLTFSVVLLVGSQKVHRGWKLLWVDIVLLKMDWFQRFCTIVRSNHQGCSIKKSVLKNLSKFAGFLLKRDPKFSCKYWEIFKNIYFEKSANACFWIVSQKHLENLSIFPSVYQSRAYIRSYGSQSTNLLFRFIY